MARLTALALGLCLWALGLGLAGPAAAQTTSAAQTPAAAKTAAASTAHYSPNRGPLRTSKDGAEEKLMLEGHDPVAYFTQQAAVKGDANITLQHLGVTWRFASGANRSLFQQDPDRYMPQFGGYCSNGINYGIPWGGGGGPDTWRIYRGKLYVFGGRQSRDNFELDTELNLQRAHQYWNDEISGSWPLFRRLVRLVFRVPHYQSDAALKAAYDAALAAGTLPVKPGGPQVVPSGLP